MIGVVAVAVQQGVDAGGVGDHVRIGEGTAFVLVAQMGQRHHESRALGAGVVHGLLHRVVQALAGLVLEEAVDEVAVFILEVLGGGGGQGLGSADAHEGDLHAVEFLDNIRSELQFAALVEVAADIGEIGHLGQFEEALHAVVELMVAHGGDIVAHGVHQLDVRFAGGHGPDRFALNGVAVVHQQHMIASVFVRVPYHGQTGVAEVALNAAMHVTGEEHHHVLLEQRRVFFCQSTDAQQHGQSEEKCKKLFHG